MDVSYKVFSQALQESQIPIFLECWASWCLPCKQYDTLLKQLSTEYDGRCRIYKVNVDKNPQISKNHEVRGLPTFITFYNGEEIDRKVSAQPEDTLRDMVAHVVSLAEGDSSDDQNTEEDDEDEIIEQRLKDLGYL